MNGRVLTDPFGGLLWASPALSSSTRGLTAARTHGIVDTVQGLGPQVLGRQGVPARQRFHPGALPRPSSHTVAAVGTNSTHAKIRCLSEQAMTTLKSWRILRKIRCSTNRIAAIVQAVLVLHHTLA
ncbi:transposase family protein [Streptomyces sp. 061-3]|uniref:transposase family protein n=1 Tax=Streptomyces sp. 061-3 TaxID=2789268 RepID=UPI00397FBDAF